LREAQEDAQGTELANSLKDQVKTLDWLYGELDKATNSADVSISGLAENIRDNINDTLQEISDTKYQLELQVDADIQTDITNA